VPFTMSSPKYPSLLNQYPCEMRKSCQSQTGSPLSHLPSVVPYLTPLTPVVTYTVASLGTKWRWLPMRRLLVSMVVSRVMEWSVPLRHRYGIGLELRGSVESRSYRDHLRSGA
jgi:hypothetical protein